MDSVRRKKPEWWEIQTWILHNDKAPANASFLFRSFLAKHLPSVVPYPPYTPDLAPADFFLFPEHKTASIRRLFQTIEKIQENELSELRAITESAFQEAFQQWNKRLERCIASRWDYFEGNSASISVK